MGKSASIAVETTGPGESEGGWCGSTDWSQLLLAGRSGAPGSSEAMENLCRRYWPAVYVYVRSRGQDPSAAEDSTQGFFAHLIANNVIAGLDESKGRFRSFLLVALKNFLANERDREQAKKRGGGRALVSLDEIPAEESYLAAESSALTPDALFARRWALEVLGQALDRLKTAEESEGRGRQFGCLQKHLTLEGLDDSYEAAEKELGLTLEAARMAVCRLRRRFRDALRAEIGSTVTKTSQVEEELTCLAEALSRR